MVTVLSFEFDINLSIGRVDFLFFLELNSDQVYTYFFDYDHTYLRKTIYFAFRQLNSSEATSYCSNQSVSNPPIVDQAVNFTANYELRLYTSGCYYLDDENVWRSDGLRVR